MTSRTLAEEREKFEKWFLDLKRWPALRTLVDPLWECWQAATKAVIAEEAEALDDAIQLIARLRSYVFCGDTIKEKDAEIKAVLDKLRAARAMRLRHGIEK